MKNKVLKFILSGLRAKPLCLWLPTKNGNSIQRKKYIDQLFILIFSISEYYRINEVGHEIQIMYKNNIYLNDYQIDVKQLSYLPSHPNCQNTAI